MAMVRRSRRSGIALLSVASLLVGVLVSCLQSESSRKEAAPPAGVTLSLFYDSTIARFSKPIWFGEFPDGSGTFAVAGLGGDIQLLRVDSAGQTTVRPFAQVPVAFTPYTDGLLGLAFHPDFVSNRKYYVYYVSALEEVTLAERMALPNAAQDAGVERRLITLPTARFAHYGGDLNFGPDGFLYLGIGDGATAGGFLEAQENLQANAQSLAVLYGKMIRIDVDNRDSGLAYAIPSDNPFAGNSDSGIRPEIWAYGLRQPWRGSFDAKDGRLIVGDVGAVHSEEINLIEKGGNYGWRRTEGSDNCFNDANFWTPLPTCTKEGISPPIAEFRRTPPYLPLSILGGYVFRGDSTSPHYGAYIFAESSNGTLYYLPPSQQHGSGGLHHPIAQATANMGGFGTDSKGNLYTIEYEAGIIRRIDHPNLTGKIQISD